MPGTPNHSLRLPEARPEAYLQLLRFCRLGMVRALGDVLTEELSAGVRWDIVDQCIGARLAGREVVAPEVHLPPHLAEMMADFLAAHGLRETLPAAASQLSEEARDLLRRCVGAVRGQLGDVAAA